MNEQDLDRLLNESLATYVAEPAPGLEQRVRRSVWRRAYGRPLLGVLAVAATLLMAFWPQGAREKRLPELPVLAGNQPAAPVEKSPHVVRPTLSPAPMPVVRSAGRRPVQSAPPVSVPLSPKERELMEFASHYPQLVQQLVEKPAATDEPLTVAPVEMQPLVIAPLESASGGGQ